MASWGEVAAAVPELAVKVQQRFDAHGLAFIATVKRDGSPRISGIEPLIAGGEVWVGMMPGSMKARDLLREPRCALHSATEDKNVKNGDAKMTASAVPVEDEATWRRYIQASEAGSGMTPGSFHLFRLDIKQISHLIPAGDHLDIEWWSEKDGYKKIERK